MIRSGGRSGPHATVFAAGRSPVLWCESRSSRPPRLVEVRRAVAVARALALDAAEQRVQRALPRQLRELVDRGDDQRRQQPVDLLVDRHDGQTLVRTLAAGELALADSSPQKTSVRQRSASLRGLELLVTAPRDTP